MRGKRKFSSAYDSLRASGDLFCLEGGGGGFKFGECRLVVGYV